MFPDRDLNVMPWTATGDSRMKTTRSSKALSARIAAHQKVEQRVAVLSKLAEVAHSEHRKAKAAYRAAKKTARLAKAAWHRARVIAREGQTALNKSAKRLAKLRNKPPVKR